MLGAGLGGSVFSVVKRQKIGQRGQMETQTSLPVISERATRKNMARLRPSLAGDDVDDREFRNSNMLTHVEKGRFIDL